jgi:hypothetical protein
MTMQWAPHPIIKPGSVALNAKNIEGYVTAKHYGKLLAEEDGFYRRAIFRLQTTNFIALQHDFCAALTNRLKLKLCNKS